MSEFPVEHAHDSVAFLRAIQVWLLGSPHSRLDEEDLAKLLDPGDVNILKGNEGIEALHAGVGDEDTAGIRYTRRESGLEWVTTVVFSRTSNDSWVAIRVSCEDNRPAIRLPPAKKPVLVRTLLDNLGGASDGSLRVGRAPVRLEDTDISLAARLILGTTGCRLPIVYVSAGFQDMYMVDVDRLANDLAGMAHVVVEPNRPFSLRLKLDVASENVYGGTVGIYWPDGGGRRSFFLGREFESPGDVAQAVFEELRTALTNRRGLPRCTWAFLQESASRQVINELRSSGSQEVDKYIRTFDQELAAKDQGLDDAETEIRRLRTELRKYEARSAGEAGALLRAGNEQDLYPNEVVGILRDAVEDACARVPEDSRRLHVLAAILEANPQSEDVSGTMRERLKQLLRGVRSIDAKVRRGLEEMGFAISEDGKHHKLVFQGDDRYTFTLPKSGGDHRGGLNAASDIGRLLF